MGAFFTVLLEVFFIVGQRYHRIETAIMGFLGIIGAMLSGITMANNHLLPELPAAEWVRILDEEGHLLALGGAATRFDRPDDLHARLVLTA